METSKDESTVEMRLKRVPRRLHRALKLYASLNELNSFEAAIIRILERDLELNQIIAQFRTHANAEEIRRTVRNSLPRTGA